MNHKGIMNKEYNIQTNSSVTAIGAGVEICAFGAAFVGP